MALREQLLAVTEELRRRKAAGEKTVPISEDTLVALRAAVAAQNRGAAGEAAVARATPDTGDRTPDTGNRSPETGDRTPETGDRKPDRGAALFGDTAPAAKPALQIAPAQEGAAIPPAPVFTLPAGDKATRWAWLKDKVENDPVCRAHVRPGKKVVLGVGTLDAKIFFCGEAPGADEEVQGEPFVGAAGQLLTKMIKAMGVDRGQVYIGNIMNWRPEMPTPPGVEQIGNRPPTAEEMTYCLPYLKAQLEIVQPEVIVALGATASAGLLGAGSF